MKTFQQFIFTHGIIFTFLVLCSIITPLTTYANVDQSFRMDYTYTCKEGTGVLRVDIVYGGNILITNIYHINHAGYVYSKNKTKDIRVMYSMKRIGGITKEDNFFVPGCGCPEPISDAQYPEYNSIKSYRDNDLRLPLKSNQKIDIDGGTIELNDTLILEPVSGGGVPKNCDVVKCGNGVKESSELCDPKDREKVGWGTGGCDTVCKPIGSSVFCGNGIKESSELCDPSDKKEKTGWGTGGCDTVCKPIGSTQYCGNGIKESSELCDPSDREERIGWGMNGCDATCKPIGPSTYCGNGFKESNEFCDPGDTSQTGWGTGGCDTVCKPIGPSTYCGNGIKESSELCDPNDKKEKTGWGTGGCDIVCKPIGVSGVSVCGNGTRELDEFCDPSDISEIGWGTGGCDTACKPIGSSVFCGNGVKETSELCDPVDSSKIGWGTGGCDTACKPIGSSVFCGNGIKESSELCDPVDSSKIGWGTGGCDTACKPIGSSVFCGNGVKETSELCDPVDSSKIGWGDTGCSPTCQPINSPNKCGNGVRDASEFCDPADTTHSGWLMGCSLGCTPIDYQGGFCGDGGKNSSEQCDYNDTVRQVGWGKYGCDSFCKPRNDCYGPLCKLSLTGVTVTDTEMCFRITDKSGKYISGLSMKGELRVTANSYVLKHGGSLTSSSIDSIDILSQKYCIDLASTGLKPGPNTYAFNATCKPPQVCTVTQPSGGITIPKPCTGYLEVLLDGEWTRDGVMYNEKQTYRVGVKGNGCMVSSNTLSKNGPSTPTGGTFTITPGLLSATGTFTAEITKDLNTPSNTPRGLSLGIMYTTPGGGRYGLTEKNDDWSDTPLSIIGNRVRGVRIIGSSIGVSTNTYNRNNDTLLSDMNTLSQIQNKLVRNITELTRNTSGSTFTGILVVRGDTDYSTVASRSFQTLVIYGDLTLDVNITNTKGIIVLKDTSGSGGNVIVADGVEKINAMIFAEGMLRGESIDSTIPNPQVQLVLKGALYSHNTIGGSADPNTLFIYPDEKVTKDRINEAFMQDLNMVRSGNELGTKYNGKYTDPFIIEYDPSIAQNPPLGFANL